MTVGTPFSIHHKKASHENSDFVRSSQYGKTWVPKIPGSFDFMVPAGALVSVALIPFFHAATHPGRTPGWMQMFFAFALAASVGFGFIMAYKLRQYEKKERSEN